MKLTDRSWQVLEVLSRSGKPLTGNEIGYACGFRSGSHRYTHNGKMLGPAQRVISPLRSLERHGLVTWGRRTDGLTGTAFVITQAGREALENRSLPKSPGAGKVEAAGIEPARHSPPNSPISSNFAQEAS